MRNLILAVLAATGLATAATAPAAAVGTKYPFCMHGRDYPSLSDCSYTSFEQCQATASGRFLECIANPYYIPPGEPRAPRRRVQPGDPAY
jgi:hypothetical protein